MADYEAMKRCLDSDQDDRLDLVFWTGDIYVPLSDVVLGRVERRRLTVPSFEIEFPSVVISGYRLLFHLIFGYASSVFCSFELISRWKE